MSICMPDNKIWQTKIFILYLYKYFQHKNVDKQTVNILFVQLV